MIRAVLIVITLAMAACTPAQAPIRTPEPAPYEHSGSALLLDLTPVSKPRVVGEYGFDVLDAVDGHACVSRDSGTRYWFAPAEVAQMASDPLTQQAIAAAAHDAVARLDDADTILLTRVVAEGKGGDRVCAHVFGRGLRITKAGEPSAPPVPKADSTDLSRP